METGKDEGENGNNNNNSNNNNGNNNETTDNTAVAMDTHNLHLTSHSTEDELDDDDFDCNDDFYLDYFSDLPADTVNGTAILETFVRTDTFDYSVSTENPNCNNNARGANNNNTRGAKKPAKKIPTPSPPPQGDPELHPGVVTLMAYGDRGVSEQIEIDMNKADDFDVSETFVGF